MAQPQNIKQEIKATKEEVKETKEEMKETKAELKVAKEEIKEVRAEMKKASADRLAIAREVEREVTSRITTVMSTALAVVAGLFWQTAINDTIKTFIPVSGAWQYEIAIAMGVTLAAAFVIYVLSKSTDRLNGK
jgi:seryl-tRNA synthetase